MSMGNGAAARPARLPVWSVARHAYGDAIAGWRHLGAPLLLLFAVILATVESWAVQGPLALWFVTAGVLVFSLLSLALTVGIYRVVLLRDMRSGLALLRFDRHLARLIGTQILFVLGSGLALGLISGLFAMAAGIFLTLGSQEGNALLRLLGGLVEFFAIIYSFRFSLAAPASAIGIRDRFAFSWRATRGNTWRLCAAAFIVALPFIVLEIGALIVAISLPSGSDAVSRLSFAPGPLAGFAMLATLALPVTAMGRARCFALLAPPADEPPLSTPPG